jgi:hypothetical protein
MTPFHSFTLLFSRNLYRVSLFSMRLTADLLLRRTGNYELISIFHVDLSNLEVRNCTMIPI